MVPADRLERVLELEPDLGALVAEAGIDPNKRGVLDVESEADADALQQPQSAGQCVDDPACSFSHGRV